MIGIVWSQAGWIAGASGIAFVVGLIVPAWVVVTLPDDYLLGASPASAGLAKRVLRNVLGLTLLAAGVVMLVTPGQGVLGILSGLILLDFPGKRSVEQQVARRPRVVRMLNRMRRRAGKPPFQVESAAATFES